VGGEGQGPVRFWEGKGNTLTMVSASIGLSHLLVEIEISQGGKGETRSTVY